MALPVLIGARLYVRLSSEWVSRILGCHRTQLSRPERRVRARGTNLVRACHMPAVRDSRRPLRTA